ncbi:MAG: lipid-A-disaccharide synthase [Nitrospira sp.]|nr:lipid-A-disaccharide synthase [Nitrospira sp.]
MPRILIIAGEASGDLHGASLAKALKTCDPTVEVAGIGGAAMKEAGVRLVEEFGGFDVIGAVGPLMILRVIRRFWAVRRLFKAEPWDAVVFIDHPGLNLRYAYFAKAAGLRVFYYIAPQIWAWRRGRIHWIKRRVDHVLVVLPFEKALYDRAKIPCTFVGHPLLDTVSPRHDRERLRQSFGLLSDGVVIALLPGSRKREVELLLPVLIEAAEKLAQRDPRAQFLLAQAPTINDHFIESLVQRAKVPIQIVKERTGDAMAAADLAWVASGTATLEAAVIGTPLILIYRTNAVTFWLACVLIRVQWIGLVNLVAGRTVVPELIQWDATGERLYEETRRLLEDRCAYDEMKCSLAKVRAALGQPGASRRAAEVVLASCRG